MAREFHGAALKAETMVCKYGIAWAGVILMALLKAIEPEDERETEWLSWHQHFVSCQ
jgi:hypothetical protein